MGRKLIEIWLRPSNWYDLLPQVDSDFSPLMKLIRFGTLDHEKPGLILDDGRRIDVLEFAVTGLGESRLLALALSRMS